MQLANYQIVFVAAEYLFKVFWSDEVLVYEFENLLRLSGSAGEQAFLQLGVDGALVDRTG